MHGGRRFLLFSGHNDRAVVALCRFFDQTGLPFCIVAAGRDDAIHATAWRDRVVFNRTDKALDVAWFRQLTGDQPGTWLYCPTTEFINDFLLRNRDALQGCGLETGLPDQEVYQTLTSKARSQAVITALCPGLRVPAPQPMQTPHAPCVLKPVANVSAGKVLYPLLCPSSSALDEALTGLDRDAYFAQDFIIGQSHYLCAYIAKDGQTASFWQTNLMQQPEGKSIVLAQPGPNPGLDAQALLTALHARGYHGPLMMEVIASDEGLFYIEINPRFWGPLQLALDVCPALLGLFAHDHGLEVALPAALPADEAVYAWAYGASTPGCVVHPAAQGLEPVEIDRLLYAYDVYAREDTLALHACH